MAGTHPLDPLSLGELARVQSLVAAYGGFNEMLRFTTTELREPAKASVLARRPREAVVPAARWVLLC